MGFVRSPKRASCNELNMHIHRHFPNNGPSAGTWIQHNSMRSSLYLRPSKKQKKPNLALVSFLKRCACVSVILGSPEIMKIHLKLARPSRWSARKQPGLCCCQDARHTSNVLWLSVHAFITFNSDDISVSKLYLTTGTSCMHSLRVDIEKCIHSTTTCSVIINAHATQNIFRLNTTVMKNDCAYLKISQFCSLDKTELFSIHCGFKKRQHSEHVCSQARQMMQLHTTKASKSFEC